MRMRYAVIGTLAAVTLAAGIMVQARAKEAAPQTVTITGQVVDLACYMRMGTGAQAEGHTSCAIACAKMGLPRGIVDSKTGEVYLSLGKSMMGAPGQDIDAFMQQQVTATGVVFKQKGIQSIAVTDIKAAK